MVKLRVQYNTDLVEVRVQYTREHCMDLVEVRVWFRLADAVEVFDVDELKVEMKAGVGHAVLRPQADMRQVAQPLVAPVVQLTDTGHHHQHHHNKLLQYWEPAAASTLLPSE